MVDISVETAEQIETRLRRVIADATLDIVDGRWCFREFALAEFPTAASPEALALIRDEDGWSQLVPAHDADRETFGLFSFHFPEGQDNSGFVGWLASHLKARFGTGVFVVCGHNAARGGVYDYWGAPSVLADAVFEEVRRMNRPEA
ncbi:DUF6196 family protein [Aureimonas phyllosphaerae]|uniref:Uncharacterized protein n=1 Tax=Aureimonas phyllosphaerae TaxID=1166078 RepID=A0A7W6FSN5_9HYPH|nr:DUF6196 family protein [Aureimonas phyllosphaerae]MBB3934141.1 hypothetical protein [Aureimonas phyllosphaerae]MBB3958643.1 hypothetical protein [Aureimonas phyllosphaerae]SFF00068.1 hypothetical protein SAMN05216566_101617 [Aureimonas phyllosphaerae]